jgi:hypothetical protein
MDLLGRFIKSFDIKVIIIYPEAIVRDEASTNKNKFKSNRLAKVPFSGARMKTADKYWAKIIRNVITSNNREQTDFS